MCLRFAPKFPEVQLNFLKKMPISQPPAGNGNTVTDKPGSVGVPVATSLAIVSRTNLRPQPWGVEVCFNEIHPFHSLRSTLNVLTHQPTPGGSRYFWRHFNAALS